MAKMTLFQFEQCPYCALVREKLSELGMDYEIVDVSYDRSSPMRKELLEKSGVGTVPVLLDDGQYIGESSRIIEFLEKRHKL
jgi:glutathione S-transferase